METNGRPLGDEDFVKNSRPYSKAAMEAAEKIRVALKDISDGCEWVAESRNEIIMAIIDAAFTAERDRAKRIEEAGKKLAKILDQAQFWGIDPELQDIDGIASVCLSCEASPPNHKHGCELIDALAAYREATK